ncbi:hotdog fold thioesterase [Microbulbifer thermotolerans]|uniref:Thioesterase n=1 Tax=Microbulbifer thermotolerans TaxID=252514 RepID=A0A143HPG4_MICTH|nr:hotdog fold thioesterase [Microbulbifer thermotolerans]AMX03391.1 thioesterase [Microbulbifer thermotolerans]MCX2781205.1 hotdog fold thioesterase [Microbulbifer thermotolerans]MCX2783019.1 hotdog fold thioesterase [Microbulbifer thermotolerans]MCX2795449.1 hotdog fold thioesterase [Microbulbifer thermotolerans]MCX2802751.1 hotdog fold thioesterase [Microbulbifer thermotolerans]
MAIWHSNPTPEQLNENAAGCMPGHIGLKITEVGDDYLVGTLPVDQRTRQPFGILHGGANVVLAETLGSMGANLVVDPEKYYCVGQEINANHLRPVAEGEVTGTAKPVHIGRSSQVWEIRITAPNGKLSCISRITMAVVAHG